jgi:dimeric dUTPase (all-alpha-NTP-PPase superfamily)
LNLIELDKLQKEYESQLLDAKGLNRKELFDKKLLALKTELGELANEHRCFKFWSEDQEPRTEMITKTSYIYVDAFKDPVKKVQSKWPGNPLLEEFIDCLKFSLSIAADLDIEPDDFYPWHEEIYEDIPKTFNLAFYYISALSITPSKVSQKNYFQNFFLHLMSLGFKHFNFTEEQITVAFKEKHKVNYKRLETGY